MPSTALDWQSTAELTGGILVALALVYLWLRHLIDGAPTESPRDTIPDLDVTFDPLGPEPFVEATPVDESDDGGRAA